jgi:signal transduction histidine kinase
MAYSVSDAADGTCRVGRRVRSVTLPADQVPEDALIGLNRQATTARLLSGAVHEVNNALQVISGTVELLESRPDMPPSCREALARLRTQSHRAALALAEVLTFTRSERRVRVPVNMRELAQDSLALRDFAIRRAHLSARLEADPGTTYVVNGNRGDLQQAVLNLVMNAERALTGQRGAIVLQLGADPQSVALCVSDDGPGVTLTPPERAFDPFVTSHDPFEAAGLGLWAARALVEQHGGTLTLERRANRTAIVMTLPRQPLAT